MPRTPFVTTMGRRRRRRKGYVRPVGMSERKKAYLAYIRSPAWRAFRVAWWEQYDRQFPVRTCYCCGKPQGSLKRSLELHHRTYERLGAERWDDLVAVCRSCHSAITKMHRTRNQTKNMMTIWEMTEARKRSMRNYQAKRDAAMGKS